MHCLKESRTLNFTRPYINCDVFTGNVRLGKLLLQGCYKQANFAEEIILVFCGQVCKLQIFSQDHGPVLWDCFLEAYDSNSSEYQYIAN